MAEEDKYDEGIPYWDNRYRDDPKPSDWILKPEQIIDVIDRIMAGPGALDWNVLHAGCGNSLLSEVMYDTGRKRQMNIDTSSVVIDQMRARNADLRPEVQWLVMDAKATGFPDGHFDLVIDKGTLDTLLCEDDEEYSMVSAYCQEMGRVMASGGIFVVITFGPPEDRLKHFSRPSLGFLVETIEAPSANVKISHCHYVYVCRKERKREAEAVADSCK